MMQVPVSSLLGLAGVPSHRTSASRWLAKAGVVISANLDDGRCPETVRLSDLPEDVRRAYELRQIEEAGLPAGEYDDEAHARFAAATPAMQTVALRKAEIARFLTKGGASDGRGLTSQLAEAARAKFGADGTDKMSLRRILRAVAGIDPVNFAPALLPGYARAGSPPAEISDEAWSFFMTTLRDAGPQFPLKQAWRDVARKRGWGI